MTRVLLLFILLVFVVPLSAQDYKFKHLSTSDGLAHKRVLCLLQDSQGYIWMGTQNGLNRYNGRDFTLYTKELKDDQSLSGNAVRSIYEDASHTIWVGTDGSGLNAFDRSTGKFKRFMHQPNNPRSLSHGDVYDIYEDRAGNFWIATWGGGLNKMDRKTGVFRSFTHDPSNPNSISDNYTRTIHEDSNGNLWIGTSYGGLSKFDPITEIFTHYTHNQANANGIGPYGVFDIIEGEAGELWIGTYGGGLSRFDVSTENFTHYSYNPGGLNSLIDNQVNALFKDKAGFIWVGTWQGGLLKFDPKKGTFEKIVATPGKPESISNNNIWDIMQDDSGLLWISTDGGGVNVADVYGNNFGHQIPNLNKQVGLANASVRALYEDSKGRVWIGTNGDGMQILDPATGDYNHYRYDPKKTNGIASDIILSFCESKKGGMWIGTYEGGLNYLPAKSGKFIPYRANPKDLTTISDDRIMVVYEDREGTLWAGTYENGLNRLDKSFKKFTRYNFEPGNPQSLSSNSVRAIYEDREGNLWVGTMGGLNKLDKRTGLFTRYVHQPGDPNSLSHNKVRTIHQDKKGNIWVGTDEGGLNLLNTHTHTFTHFTKEQGLKENTIMGIVEDTQGNLWLSTNKGLSKFNIQSRTFKNYDETDGLQGNEFCIGAYHKGKSGKVYFGGYNGFNAFYPEDIKDFNFIPPVVIADFKIFDQSAPQKLKDSTIELTYKDNFFSFDFAALSYKNPEKNNFAYQLTGFDKDWIYSGTRHYASYTNLDPGTYVLQVKASNSDGVWNEFGTSLRIIITPPYWQTSWFRLSFISLLAVLAFIIYKFRVNAIQQQKKRLEQLVAQRTEELKLSNHKLSVFLAESEKQKKEAQYQYHRAEEANRFKTELMDIAAHDLKNPLGGIRLYAELLKNFAYSPDKVVSLATTIENMSQSMIGLLSRVMGTLHTDSLSIKLKKHPTNLSLLVEEQIEINRPAADKKNQVFHFSGDHKCIAMVDWQLMNEIVDNLLSNAIKYSYPSSNIYVSVKKENEILYVAIKDEGIGIEQSHISQLFGKFRRFANTTGGESSTGLGLAIVKQLVELHKGTIKVESEGLAKGSTFTFSLPALTVSSRSKKKLNTSA